MLFFRTRRVVFQDDARRNPAPEPAGDGHENPGGIRRAQSPCGEDGRPPKAGTGAETRDGARIGVQSVGVRDELVDPVEPVAQMLESSTMRKFGKCTVGDAEFLGLIRGEQSVVPDGLIVDGLVSGHGHNVTIFG